MQQRPLSFHSTQSERLFGQITSTNLIRAKERKWMQVAQKNQIWFSSLWASFRDSIFPTVNNRTLYNHLSLQFFKDIFFFFFSLLAEEQPTINDRYEIRYKITRQYTKFHWNRWRGTVRHFEAIEFRFKKTLAPPTTLQRNYKFHQGEVSSRTTRHGNRGRRERLLLVQPGKFRK